MGREEGKENTAKNAHKRTFGWGQVGIFGERRIRRKRAVFILNAECRQRRSEKPILT